LTVQAVPANDSNDPAGQGATQQTWAALGQAHIYHVSSARDDLPAPWWVNAALLQRCPQLLAVSTYGAGYDTVDVAACTAAGVAVINQAGSNAQAVAEHTLGLMLTLSKRIAQNDKRLRRGERFTRVQGMGSDLAGATLGLVGLGHTGQRVAVLAAAFGMQVLACDPYLDAAQIRQRGAEPVGLAALLQRADMVSVHCPLDASTRGLFNATTFAAMRRGAIFVSTARGGIHEEAALHAALLSGHIAGAGLDVWAVEPPPADHPLLALDQVVATAHTAGVTRGARAAMATMAATQIAGLARGERPSQLVNPSVWAAVAARLKARTTA
jgi:D-3-phosphoglycerate dehydrogenase / 2-oxoglutarate reductase